MKKTLLGIRRPPPKLPMERLRALQQAAHHDGHRKRVPAPLLLACAAQGLRSRPPLRLSSEHTPSCSHRSRSAAARLSASSNFASHQLFASSLAWSALRSQHEHRSQPHRATAGVSMQATGLFMTLGPLTAPADVTTRLRTPASRAQKSNSQVIATSTYEAKNPARLATCLPRSQLCLVLWDSLP